VRLEIGEHKKLRVAHSNFYNGVVRGDLTTPGVAHFFLRGDLSGLSFYTRGRWRRRFSPRAAAGAALALFLFLRFLGWMSPDMVLISRCVSLLLAVAQAVRLHAQVDQVHQDGVMRWPPVRLGLCLF
jgi:hypothetical protein